MSLNPGTHEGAASYTVDTGESFSERGLFCELGSGTRTVKPTDALTDNPIGVVEDEGAAGDEVAVQLAGASGRTVLMRAGETIVAGDLLVAGPTGRAMKLPAAAGSYFISGKALSAAEAGEQFEAVLTFPVLRVVT